MQSAATRTAAVDKIAGFVTGLGCTALRAVVRVPLLRVLVLLSFVRNTGLRSDFVLAIGISFGCAATTAATTEAHLGQQAGGAGSRSAAIDRNWSQYRSVCAGKSQSFLDNDIAGLGTSGAS